MSLPVARTGIGTNGVVSWSDLGTKTVSFSVEVLARIAAAGVNPYTIVVGQTVAQNFRLSRQGRQNVQTALSSLKGFRSWGSALWFGFGVKSIVHDLNQSDEGCCLLALCGALSECFNENYAAEVLQEMVQTLKPPGQFTPSTKEWLSVVQTCAGIFTTSPFPVSHGLIVTYAQQSKIVPPDELRHTRPPAPEQLAAILMALGQLSRKDLKSIDVHGTLTGVWVVTFAVWFFDLTAIISTSDGEVLYSTSKSNEAHQLVYTLESASIQHATGLEILGKSYLLTQGWNDLHKDTEGKSSGVVVRTPWDSVLSSTFGSCFSILNSNPVAFGTTIGCLATYYEKFLLRVDDDGKSSTAGALLELRFYASYGSGMNDVQDHIVQSIRAWFPEVNISDDAVRDKSISTLEDADLVFEETIKEFKTRCPCRECEGPGRRRRKMMNAGDPCLCYIPLFIMTIAMFLTSVKLSDNLYVVRQGISAAYRNLRLSFDESLPKISLWESFSEFSHFISPESRIQLAHTLFTGREGEHLRGNSQSKLCATSRAGICCYYGILNEISLDTCAAARIHITPGRIERDGKPYHDVADMKIPIPYPCEKLIYPLQPPSLLVQETAYALRAAYQFAYPGGLSIHVGGADLVNNLISSRFRRNIGCQRKNCKNILPEDNMKAGKQLQKLDLFVPTDVEEDHSQESHDQVVKHDTVWLYSGDEFDTCGFLAVAHGTIDCPKETIILTGSACKQCCLRHLSSVAGPTIRRKERLLGVIIVG